MHCIVNRGPARRIIAPTANAFSHYITPLYLTFDYIKCSFRFSRGVYIYTFINLLLPLSDPNTEVVPAAMLTGNVATATAISTTTTAISSGQVPADLPDVVGPEACQMLNE